MIPPKPSPEDRPSGVAGLDQRSRDIFRRLVDTYLETGEPVGAGKAVRITRIVGSQFYVDPDVVNVRS